MIASLAITEPSGGSNLREVSTTYQQSGNKFKLNGIKRWITFGGIADLILVVANGDAGLLVFCLDPKKLPIPYFEKLSPTEPDCGTPLLTLMRCLSVHEINRGYSTRFGRFLAEHLHATYPLITLNSEYYEGEVIPADATFRLGS